MIPIFLQAALLLAPSPPGAPSAPKADTVIQATGGFQVRLFHLPSLKGPIVDPGEFQVGSLFPAWTKLGSTTKIPPSLLFGLKIGSETSGDPFLPSDTLLGDLMAWTGREPWDKEGAFLQELGNGSRLLACQVPEFMKMAADALAGLREVLRPRVSYRMALYLEGGPPPLQPLQVMDPARGETLFRQVTEGRMGRLLYTSSGRGKAHDSLFLGRTRVFSFLKDLEVEVAQGASISDPQMGSFELRRGVRLTALPSLTGSRMELFGLFFFQELAGGPIGMGLQTGKPRMFMERARVENFQTGFATLFTDRLALLLAPGGWKKPHLRLLLLVKRLDPYPSLPEGMLFVNTGKDQESLFSNGAFPERNLEGKNLNLEEWAPSYPSLENLVELLKALQPGSLDVENGPFHILVKGPKNLVEKAKKLTEMLYKGYKRRFHFEVFREISPADPMSEEERSWLPLAPPTEIPCLGGRTAFAFQGREESFVKDMDVEIAQKAATCNPIVEGCFDGSQVLVRVEPAGDQCSVKLDLLEASVLGIRRIASAENTNIGTIQAPDLRVVRWKETFYMKPGEVRSLGYGPPRLIDGRLYKTRISIRLQEP